jgi:hypothetical protein
MTYPIKLRAAPRFIEELYWCEHGRFEDAQAARAAGDQEAIEANDYQVVACDFLDRHKTLIEVRTDAELSELYYALASGTIGVCGHAAQANRLLNKIRDRTREIDPEIVALWPRQEG